MRVSLLKQKITYLENSLFREKYILYFYRLSLFTMRIMLYLLCIYYVRITLMLEASIPNVKRHFPSATPSIRLENNHKAIFLVISTRMGFLHNI